MDKEKEETKRLIMSVLISTPFNINMKKLSYDFKDQMGYPIPFREFGFSSLELYLRSLNDILEILGQGPEAEIKVKPSKKSAHIDKLVTKQKTIVRGPARFRFNTNKRRHEYYSEPLRNNMNYNYYPPTCKQPPPRFQTQKTGCNNFLPAGYQLDSSRNHNPNNSPIVIKQKNETYVPNSPNIEQSVETAKPTVKANNSPTRSLGAIPKSFSSVDVSDDTYWSESDDEQIFSCKVPQSVQQNLRSIIADAPDGIWCAKLPQIYRQRFNVELDYNAYGYQRLINMCSDLEKIFHCIRPDKEDFKLYDKSKPIPDEAFRELKVSEYFQLSNSAGYSVEPAIPDIAQLKLNTDESVCNQSDIVRLNEELPKAWLPPDVQLMDFIDVCVTEIYDPSKFWISLIGDHYSTRLEEMMDEMQLYYRGEGSELVMPESNLAIGLYCAAIVFDEFHRGIIVNKPSNTPYLVRIFCIDYGTVAAVNIKKVYSLHRKYFVLPHQAIRARLANIYPPVANSQWTMKCCKRFLALVKEKRLVAQIYRKDEERLTIEVFLADTSGPTDLYINDALVDDGHAIFTYQEQRNISQNTLSKPLVKYVHLAPTFKEIECATVPSLHEMNQLCNSGMAPEYFYPHYFQNDVSNDILAFHENEQKVIESAKQKVMIDNPARSRLHIYNEHSQQKTELSSPPLTEGAIYETPLRPPPGFKPLPQGFKPNLQWSTNTPNTFVNPMQGEVYSNIVQPPSSNMNMNLINTASYLYSMSLVPPTATTTCDPIREYLSNQTLTRYLQQLAAESQINNTLVENFFTGRDKVIPQLFENLDSPLSSTENKVTNERLVISMKLDQQTIHVIRHENEFYALVDEIVPMFLGKLIPITTIRRSIGTSLGSLSIKSIDLKEHSTLFEELERISYVPKNQLLQVMVLKDVPEILRILGSKKNFQQFDEFLNNVYNNCEIWQ